MPIHFSVTVACMSSGGLRSTSLSSYTELDARQNAQIRYKPRHYLYTMLC